MQVRVEDFDGPVVLDSPMLGGDLVELFGRYGPFDLPKITEAWAEIERDFPLVIEHLQQGFRPHSMIESIALLHASMNWLTALESFVESTRGVDPQGDPSSRVEEFRKASAIASGESLWATGFGSNHFETPSFDGVVEKWNDAVSRFKIELGTVKTIEDLERLVARSTEGFVRLALVRFSNAQYSHLEVVHQYSSASGDRWLEPEHPVHHAMHLSSQETKFVFPAARLLHELRARFDDFQYPFDFDVIPAANARKKSCSDRGYDFGWTDTEYEISVLRDCAGELLDRRTGHSPLLSIEHSLVLGERIVGVC